MLVPPVSFPLLFVASNLAPYYDLPNTESSIILKNGIDFLYEIRNVLKIGKGNRYAD